MWKEQFSTPLETAQGSPDSVGLSWFPQAWTWYPGSSTSLSGSGTQVEEDALLTADCQQQLISLVCNWTVAGPAHLLQSWNASIRKTVKSLEIADPWKSLENLIYSQKSNKKRLKPKENWAVLLSSSTGFFWYMTSIAMCFHNQWG